MEKKIKNKIKFIPSSKEVFEHIDIPQPANKFVPEWYKKSETSDFKKNPIFNENGHLVNKSLKMCMPFLDSLTTGYIQSTWCDIYIERIDKENVKFGYSSFEIMDFRDKLGFQDEDFFKNFYPIEFTWKFNWVIKTPKNYGVLITHPLNRLDLPFYTLSGIIDSDLFYHTPGGNLPFYIKKDFQGLIPAGTPMYQIIPIKRERWTRQKEKLSNSYEKNFLNKKKVFWEFYKKNMWQKKEYE
jgi:hypothetical protein